MSAEEKQTLSGQQTAGLKKTKYIFKRDGSAGLAQHSQHNLPIVQHTIDMKPQQGTILGSTNM